MSNSSSDLITIGKQVWSRKNLSVTEFRNGDRITRADSPEEWSRCFNNNIPAWCFYENDSSNVATNGILYNYHAINDSRGIAPYGMRVADANDWCRLLKHLDSLTDAGIVRSLKSRSGWDNNGVDRLGFEAKPSGARNGSGGFFGKGRYCAWWILNATESDSCSITSYFQGWQSGRLELNGGINVRYLFKSISAGLSVRCIQSTEE